MDELLIDCPDRNVLRLRLNRPERLNAIDAALAGALSSALDGVEERSVVLDAVGDRAFCSGVDLDIGDAERAAVSDQLYELYEKMVRLPVPIVIALEGYAVGAGAQLALAADLRIAGSAMQFRVAGPGHGLAVGAWGLPSLVGRGRAMDLCLNMRSVGAQEAFSIGLVDRVVENPGESAVELASYYATLSFDAVSRVKAVVNSASARLDLVQQEREGNLSAWSGSTEGLSRPIEKGGP
jgi:enoyl-CoA hydratase